MRLVTYRAGTAERVGVLRADQVIDLHAAAYSAAVRSGAAAAAAASHAAVTAPTDMVAFFARGPVARSRAENACTETLAAFERGDTVAGSLGEPAVLDLADVEVLAPVVRPRRIRDYLCYPAHLALTSDGIPPAFEAMPIAWKGNPDTVVGPDVPLVWPAYTDQLDFEAEIGFFVGTPGRDISTADAWDHIAGVTIFNDVSARDIQFFEMQLGLGPAKGKDFCTAMGPCVATLDELDVDDIAVTVRVNGETWVQSSTGTAAYSFGEVLAWASYGEPVYAGEFLATGTVDQGCGLELDRWVQPGDVIEIEVAGIGVLRNTVGVRQSSGPDAGLRTFTGAPRVGSHS